MSDLKHLYQYEAAVLEVIDGDTFLAMVSLGFDIFVEKKVRIYGIDTAEKNQPLALDAEERLKELIEGKKVLLIAVHERDKYGRFLAKCMTTTSLAQEVPQNVGEILILEGLAKEYYGGKKS